MLHSVKLGTLSRGKRADVVVVGHLKGSGPDRATLDALGPASDAVAAAAKRPEATGDAGRITEVFPDEAKTPARVLLVGLGAKGELEAGSFRNIAAAVGRRLAVIRPRTVDAGFGGPIASAKLDEQRCGEAFGEGLGLLTWSRDQYKGSATGGKAGGGRAGAGKPRITVVSGSETFAAGIGFGLGLAASANVARDLSEAPPNICTPDYVAREAQKLARATPGLSCSVIRGAKLLEERLVGLHTVGDASENKPCLIRLSYTPASRGRRSSKPAVLVGKTITYDSGGLSLKINNSMRGMKRDMDGGAAVFGAMHAIATVIKPRRPVVAYLAAAENAISDEAYRPDDILEYRNGVTVEVTNTDAEGRLVLADALCYACDKDDPAYIVDMATLTGGVVVALGSTYAGLWCDDEALRGRLDAASERSGERLWRLPCHREHREMMKSDVADIWNSAPVRAAHPIQGAAFLSYFVKPGVSWAHIDIAGVHSVDSDQGPYVKNGPTGFGARLLADLLDQE